MRGFRAALSKITVFADFCGFFLNKYLQLTANNVSYYPT